MEMESDLMIEKMSVREIRNIIEDLNDKNQMLESHLNIMKKYFQVVIKFQTFLENICHKFDNYVSEDESKQLCDFKKHLNDIYHGQVSTNILMEAMGEPSDVTSLQTFNEVSTTEKSDDSYVCPHKDCSQMFKTKTDISKHLKSCSKFIETIITESCDSSEAESEPTIDLKNRMTAKKGISGKQKKKTSKMKVKTNEKTDTWCQTPFSSALMSLASKGQTKSKPLNKSTINGRKNARPSSLLRTSGQKLNARLTTSSGSDSEDTNKKGLKNEELIVSHNTDSNESFGEWIDTNSDSYFKCSETSCGQLFPGNTDLLRHIETTHSSDVVFLDSDANDDHFSMKTEPALFEDEFEIKEILDDSNHLLEMDQFAGQLSNNSVNSITIQNKSTNERPFRLTLNSNPEQGSSLTTDPNLSESLNKCSEPLCQMTFEDDMDLIIHLKTIHNKKVKKCTFNGCPFLYENRSLLWIHLKECHKGQQMPFKCTHPSCTNAFLTEADLNRHITSFHAVDRHSNISGIFISDTLSNCQSVKRRKK